VIALSPGVAQGCFELLEIVYRSALTFPQIKSSFDRLGSVSSGRVIETAQALNWLQADEHGMVNLTPTGARLRGLSGYEAMLRQALLDYIDVARPAWTQNATFGRKKVIAFAGNQVGQVFVEAGLADGTDEAVVSFWDTLAALARGQKSDRLLAIGRQGERLTMVYEETRTGSKPKWVAVDNNEDGYDVLSIVAAHDPRSLSIEVKTSTLGLSALFHVTRNEWERAELTENHVFHLWDLAPNRQPFLAVISPEELQSHIPSDRGHGRWQTAHVSFDVFGKRFARSELAYPARLA